MYSQKALNLIVGSSGPSTSAQLQLTTQPIEDQAQCDLKRSCSHHHPLSGASALPTIKECLSTRPPETSEMASDSEIRFFESVFLQP